MAVFQSNVQPTESIETDPPEGRDWELAHPTTRWNLPVRLMGYLRREGWVSDRFDAVLFGFVVFAVVFIFAVAVAFLLHLLPRGGTTIEVTCPAGQQPQVTNDDGRTTVICLAPAPK